MNVSIFKNFNKITDQQPITVILEQIRTGKYQKEISALRELLDADKLDLYNQQKKSLLAFTPSASFEGGRKMEFLEEYSGLIILDIDKLPPDQLTSIKQMAANIAFTYSAFTSPSGNGLKVLVRIRSPKENHTLVFNQVKNFYENSLKVSIDPSGKDITRLCFFSWDPDLYFNPNSEIFLTTAKQTVDQIETVINLIESTHTDITNNYEDWISICFALIDALGSNAREPFHRISRFYSGYDESKCDIQFDKCLHSNNNGITIKSFFYYAKNHGISFTPVTEQPVLSLSKESRSDRGVLPVIEPSVVTEPVEVTTSLQSVSTEITGKQSEEPPKVVAERSRSKTNKFHLVRDYLIENFDIRYNNVSTEFEYKEKHQSDFKPINENDIFIKMQLDGLNLSLGNLVAFLKSSMVSKHNPFVQYFSSLQPWDGEKDYIQELASFVILKPEVRTRFDTHFKKWLVRVVKCALVDSYFNKQAFILVHDKQNSGKSTFCRFLCPPQLSNYIAENLSIDKDSRILLTTNLLINLDELSTLSKFEINALKSLFSKDKINDRLPYDRKNSIIPRRASFIGSTNQAEFLNDESGSVRWLCFVIESIDWSYSEKVNINNVWSQAYHLFKTNFPCDLTPEEIKENDESNRQFHITTPEFELIHKFLEPSSKDTYGCFMSATEILLFLSEQTNGKIKLNTINIGRALKMLSFNREKKYPERNYGYYVFKKLC